MKGINRLCALYLNSVVVMLRIPAMEGVDLALAAPYADCLLCLPASDQESGFGSDEGRDFRYGYQGSLFSFLLLWIDSGGGITILFLVDSVCLCAGFVCFLSCENSPDSWPTCFLAVVVRSVMLVAPFVALGFACEFGVCCADFCEAIGRVLVFPVAVVRGVGLDLGAGELSWCCRAW
ncbi:hypothetical protein Dimus_006537 [Dionaea muscipula]